MQTTTTTKKNPNLKNEDLGTLPPQKRRRLMRRNQKGRNRVFFIINPKDSAHYHNLHQNKTTDKDTGEHTMNLSMWSPPSFTFGPYQQILKE